jgi:predicted ATPase
VPLFAEELAKGVVESGHDLTGSFSALAIPETLHDSLMARLDRLGDAKGLAQVGSAIGREFPYALLEAVAPLKEAELREGLGRLVEAELLYQRGLPPKASYTFKHALVQDTAYQSLLASQRREIHGRIADALEARFPERVTREPEEIARHCEEAERTAAAIAHYQRAGERALQRFAYAEAIAQLRRAIELLGTLSESSERDRQELPLQVRLAAALTITRGLSSPGAEQAYVRARYLSEQLGDAPELFRALFGLHELHFFRAEYETARELAEEMLRRARQTRDPAQLVVALWMTGAGSFYRGEFSRAREHLEEAIGLYDPQDYKAHEYRYTRVDPGIAVLGNASGVLWRLGYPDQASARIEEARTLARELADPFSQGCVHTYGNRLFLSCGEHQTTLEGAEAVMALANEHGFWQSLGLVGVLQRARALTRLGQLDEGIAGMRAIVDAMQASGTKADSSETLAALARALGDAGQVEEGLALLAEAQAFVASSGERSDEAEIHRVKGELLLALPTPDPAQAEASFREALGVARRQSARSLELRAATSLARLWQRQGRKEEARALLQPVTDWFTEGFDTADLKEAKALLEEL